MAKNLAEVTGGRRFTFKCDQPILVRRAGWQKHAGQHIPILADQGMET